MDSVDLENTYEMAIHGRKSPNNIYRLSYSPSLFLLTRMKQKILTNGSKQNMFRSNGDRLFILQNQSAWKTAICGRSSVFHGSGIGWISCFFRLDINLIKVHLGGQHTSHKIMPRLEPWFHQNAFCVLEVKLNELPNHWIQVEKFWSTLKYASKAT